MIGERLGGFEVIEEIGRGGMGVVYLARQVSLDRRAALKTIRPGTSADPAAVERFQVEAHAASRLTHPNLTQIYDVGIQGDVHFLAMELVEGRSLLEMVAQEAALDPLRTVDIGRQVALGLDALHKAGIVHRDVKPGNIIVRPDGVVKLTDFGLALLQESARRLTQDGQTVGTVDYISPEQVRGATVDGRSDIYSLGIVMYRMLAGTVPFSGNTAAVLHMQVEEAPGDLRLVVPGLPTSLSDAIMRCLSKEPGDRFQTAEALAARLEDIQMEMRFLTLHERTVVVPPKAPPRTPGARQGLLDRAAESVVVLFSAEARRSRALLRTAAQAEQTLVGLGQVRDRQSELERKVRSLKVPGPKPGSRDAAGTGVAEAPGEWTESTGPTADLAVLESELDDVVEQARRLETEYERLQSQRGDLVALAEQQSARAIRSPQARAWRRRIAMAFIAMAAAAAAVFAVLSVFPGSRAPRLGPFPVGPQPWGIAARDLNADQVDDLACANWGEGTVSVVYGAGDGTFGLTERYTAIENCWGILAEDFNRNGLADLAVSTQMGAGVVVLYGAAREGARTAQMLQTALGGPALASDDFDSDGFPDIIAGNLTVLMGTGRNEFGRRIDYQFSSTVRSATTGDLNGDGKPDIAVAMDGENKVEVLYGEGDGTFPERWSYDVWELPYSVAAADIDGDGWTDLAVTNYGAGMVTVVWLGEGKAAVQERVCRGLRGPACIRVVDANRDGLLDLIIREEQAGSIVLALQTEPRHFRSVSYSLATQAAGMAVADLDDNGYPDVATTHGTDNGEVWVLMNPALHAR